MIDSASINGDGTQGYSGRLRSLYNRAQRAAIMLDARWRILSAEPEEGAATAEYAVVLVAATGFAAVLVTLLKSDATKTLLTNIVKKALSIS